MSRSRILTVALVTVIGLAAASPLVGCKKKKAAPPPPPPPPPPADPFDGLSLDPRVQFPEERNPASPEMAQAVADVANALASGNGGEMRGLLGEGSSGMLTYLLDNGQWKDATASIEIVRVCVLEKVNDSSIRVGYGIQDASGAYLIALSGSNTSGDWVFEGSPVEWLTGSVASEFDGSSLPMPMLAQAAEEYVPPAPEKEEDDSRNRDDDRTRPGGFTKPGIF